MEYTGVGTSRCHDEAPSRVGCGAGAPITRRGNHHVLQCGLAASTVDFTRTAHSNILNSNRGLLSFESQHCQWLLITRCLQAVAVFCTTLVKPLLGAQPLTACELKPKLGPPDKDGVFMETLTADSLQQAFDALMRFVTSQA